jgi:hypothetical protein
MNSETKKNFTIFLESNPKLYAIAKSNVCIALLEQLFKQGLPIDEIKKLDKFSYMSEKDIETLLELLTALKVLAKQQIPGKFIYFANNNTKLFLEIYNETKKQYSVGK